jgi:uncharacterized protein (TIGR02147 family)
MPGSTYPSIDFLNTEFERRVKANPRYSLRAFARDLRMSPGEISELLSGKRQLTLKAIGKISRRLGLSDAETRELLERASFMRAGLEDPKPEGRAIDIDLFNIVSDWYCFAILNLFDTDTFKCEPAWIGRRLGISGVEARMALERLERVGLLKRGRGGRLAPDSEFVMSPSGIPAEAIRKYHATMLAKAAAALETQAVDERDITGMGMAIDPADLPAIARELRDFRDRIAARYTRGKRTEVYQLEMALFRITEKEKGNRK